MSNIENFKMALAKLRNKGVLDSRTGQIHVTDEQDIKDAAIMSNPNNWCCVRAIDERPRYDKEGNIILPSLSTRSNYEIERHTVHTTLNHVVESHSEGNWDGFPYVVFCPYNDVVAKNGKPVGLNLVDTYFSTDIDVGLVIPKESAYIVQPASDNDGELYTIGEHVATYKTDYFTDDEIKQILSLLSPSELKEYDRLMNGDLESGEMQKALEMDPRVKGWYEKATDKKLFLKGLMEENRMTILTHFLRDAVLRLAMREKGFQYIDDAAYRAGASNYGQCNSQVAKAVEDVAISERIDTGAWRHSSSVYGRDNMQKLCEQLRLEVERITSEKNMDNLFDEMYKWHLELERGHRSVNWNDVIVNGKFIDDYYDRFFESYFQKYKQEQVNDLNRLDPEYLDRYGYMYSDILKFDTIEEFDPMFAKALKRQVEVNMTKLRKWRSQMEHNPKFQKLLEKWKDFIACNYEDYKEFMKPSIEQQFAHSSQSYQFDERKM